MSNSATQPDFFREDQEPVENELDLNEKLLADFERAALQATDWTIGTIVSQVTNNRIQLKPRFQRRDAWTDANKSKFIESLLLEFPIPQLVLAELPKKKGSYIVIDGKQRLLSILQFVEASDGNEKFDKLKLEGLAILKQFDGKTYSEIVAEDVDTELISAFDNRTIRTVVIRHWQHDEILYYIFLRLNTGSVQLSPQELRNALHPGPFAELVDSHSGDSPGLRKILKRDTPDFRMRDAEILLRYFAFKNFLPVYAGSMKDFLDTATKRFNEDWDAEKGKLFEQIAEFESGVDLAYRVFHADAFRKWKDNSFAGNFNRAVFDIIIFYFSRPDLQERIAQKAISVKNAFIGLSTESPEFVTSLETTTKSLGATVTRFALWTEQLNRAIHAKLPIPTLVDKRIHF